MKKRLAAIGAALAVLVGTLVATGTPAFATQQIRHYVQFTVPTGRFQQFSNCAGSGVSCNAVVLDGEQMLNTADGGGVYMNYVEADTPSTGTVYVRMMQCDDLTCLSGQTFGSVKQFAYEWGSPSNPGHLLLGTGTVGKYTFIEVYQFNPSDANNHDWCWALTGGSAQCTIAWEQ